MQITFTSPARAMCTIRQLLTQHGDNIGEMYCVPNLVSLCQNTLTSSEDPMFNVGSSALLPTFYSRSGVWARQERTGTCKKSQESSRDLGLDRAVGSRAAAEQAAPITIQAFCHVTGMSHDCVVSTQSGSFVNPWWQLRAKISAFCVMTKTFLNGLTYKFQLQDQF